MEILLKALATWRISHMLVHESGPGNLVHDGKKWIDNLWHDPVLANPWNPLHCVWCTSIWVAPIIYRAPRWVYIPWALSAMAIVLDEIYQWHEVLFEQSSH
jgi:hypothetical protein